MFYVIHIPEKKSWIWIKSKKDAVFAAEVLSREFDVSLQSSDGFGNYINVPFNRCQQVSLFGPGFDDLFERYVYHDGYCDFYAYRRRSSRVLSPSELS